MSEQFDVKNLPDTLKTLSRGVVTAIKYKGEPILADNRNQSFSVSRKSKRIHGLDIIQHGNKKGDLTAKYIDDRLLQMQTAQSKLTDKAGKKKQNSTAPLPTLERIDRKLNKLIWKRSRNLRFSMNTEILDALIAKCTYHRHTETVRANDYQDKGDAKDLLPIVGQLETGKPVNVGYINQFGETVPNGGINVPLDKIAVGEVRPVTPSFTRSYKIKRKVLRDRPSTVGGFDPTKEARKVRGDQAYMSEGIKRVTGKPVKARKPSHTKRGPGSY